MARVTTAVCRFCRREGEKLFLKGTRCASDKCAFMKRESPPGQHGAMRKRKPSNYAIQLREKQKAKRIYGVLEKQFSNYFEKAERKKGATGEVLFQFLECRLDNVIFRARFARSRSAARQLVGHRFVKVNGKKVNIASYLVSAGDDIEMTGTNDQLKTIGETIKILEDRMVPEWMEVSDDKMAIKIKRLPARKELGIAIEENLIVELYSK
ncbi:MAG: 30S ribosomal protein S4 [Candidatus Omnitrophota bacterium]